MKLGVQLPTRGPSVGPREILATALEAERLGFDAVFVGDHVVLPYQVDSWYPNSASGKASAKAAESFADPFVVLSYVAARTQRVRLVMAVCVLPYRNPLVTAKMVGSLDHLSEGRVVFGVGAGWMAEEFAALGVPFAGRGKRTDEYIRVLRALWEGRAAFEGQFVQFPEVGCLPAPVRRSALPILVGGHTDRALRRAAELGDGWIASGLPPAAVRQGVAKLHTLWAQHGRPAMPEVAVSVDAVPAAPGSTNLVTVARLGDETGGQRAGRTVPLETALSEFADAGVDLVLLRIPAAVVAADPAVLEVAMSCAANQ